MKKQRKIAIGVLSAGIALLIGGIVALVLNLTWQPEIRDAEYLTSVSEWVQADAPGVIWRFTEIGKGTLTTNEHLNDYAFEWALENDTLTILTEWLYDLNDQFDYQLNRSDHTLTLSRGDETVVFNAVETN